jgi:hypothetical protein
VAENDNNRNKDRKCVRKWEERCRWKIFAALKKHSHKHWHIRYLNWQSIIRFVFSWKIRKCTAALLSSAQVQTVRYLSNLDHFFPLWFAVINFIQIFIAVSFASHVLLFLFVSDFFEFAFDFLLSLQ